MLVTELDSVGAVATPWTTPVATPCTTLDLTICAVVAFGASTATAVAVCNTGFWTWVLFTDCIMIGE